MKHWLLPCCVLAALLSASLWNAAAVARWSEGWRAELGAAAELTEEGKLPAAADALERAYAAWSARQPWLHVVTVHDALDEIETLFTAARLHAGLGNAEDLLGDLAALETRLILLREREALRAENIL